MAVANTSADAHSQTSGFARVSAPHALRGTQRYPDYALDGTSSPSRYRAVDSTQALDYYAIDSNLDAVLQLHAGPHTMAWARERLHTLGAMAGGDIVRRAEAYDAAGHELVRYDRFGRDISQIAYHPDWLTNLNAVFDFGLVGWNHDRELLGRYGRAPVTLLTAFDYLVGQADMALCCPLELAHGTVAVLERFGAEANRTELLPSVVATTPAQRRQVAQVATEITGGSDIGASRTSARLTDGRWVLDGEKWFASNVGAELIVTLGRVDPTAAGTKGLAMFVVPRTRRDGSPNGVSIRRLKDKLGTIGVPTGELIFTDAEAIPVGDPADGFRAMAEMLNHTRYWNAVGSLGLMRRAFVEAAAYAARRRSFDTTIDSFPMVRERLVWLHVDLAATTALTFHTAAALEDHQAGGDAGAHLRFRTLAPVIKYRAGEQNIDFARAAVETLGGNGYVADFGTPRLLRDAQVNTIWEGTANICALDLLRAIDRDAGHDVVLDHAETRLAELNTPAGRRAAGHARRLLRQARRAISGLADEPRERREQQARRLADLFGDAVALAALATEADFEARRGDWRKALTAELFAARHDSAAPALDMLLDGLRAVPDTYPALFGQSDLDQTGYHAALDALSRR